ncbi:YgaP-like transmembrane domain [Peribacillus sp. NPDC094092]|uniref:YgaP-like transmembrane domain n=1 Tax=Peribacillus sp. NPDC094092 TaxID=3390611 RepID=UPI003D0192EE
MKFKQNISIINALMRITCGFTFLTWAMAKMVKKPWKNQSYIIVVMLSAMKIGEGILRYCPVVDAMENRQNLMTNEPKQEHESNQYDHH